jgi:large subunit ribosomal protein L9
MQIVLTKRVPKLGNEHDVVDVKPGFAWNYLFPQKLAIPADKQATAKAEKLKAQMVQKLEEMLENAKEIAEKLKEITLSFKMKAKDEKLYGSVKDSDIVDALAAQEKIEIKKDMVEIGEPIKTTGEHTVKLNLAEDVEVKLKLNVEGEE